MKQIHCLKCWYIFNGLDNSRCPECGREFDINDPRTYGIEQEDDNNNREILIPLFAAAVVGGFILFFSLTQHGGLVHWLWSEYVMGRQGI